MVPRLSRRLLYLLSKPLLDHLSSLNVVMTRWIGYYGIWTDRGQHLLKGHFYPNRNRSHHIFNIGTSLRWLWKTWRRCKNWKRGGRRCAPSREETENEKSELTISSSMMTMKRRKNRLSLIC